MEIRIENLKKKYGDRTVLEIEELVLPAGERIAVIGENGAGKSTLMNILAGLVQPEEGRIWYDGSREAPRKRMTMVFQEPYLLRTSVEGNVGYPLRIRHWEKTRTEERVTALCEDLNLAGLRRQKSWKLSGGERQKVALARALAFEPELLFLDEPTASIDPASTLEIERMLKKTGKQKRCQMILVTHNLAQVKRLCSYCVMLHRGKVAETGPVEKLLRDPHSEITRSFIEGRLMME